MPHNLTKTHPDNPHHKPLLIQLRYRCGCANNEVITLNYVIDEKITEDQFVWLARTLLRDMRFEIKQHIKP